MVITIHQPEHFPYEGFFQKMAAAELFIILDKIINTIAIIQSGIPIMYIINLLLFIPYISRATG